MLEDQIGQDITSCTFEIKDTAEVDAFGRPNYWRNRLLKTFQTRLDGARTNDVNESLIQELIDFLSKLKSIDETEILYSWTATTNSKNWNGWATENEILYKY